MSCTLRKACFKWVVVFLSRYCSCGVKLMDLNIQQYLHLFRARIALIVGALILSVITALVITILLPDTYKATATLNFDLSASDPVSARQSAVAGNTGYIATQIGIITSLNVAQRVVDSLSDEDTDRLEQSFYAEHSVIDDLSRLPFKYLYKIMDWVEALVNGEGSDTNVLVEDSAGASLEPNLGSSRSTLASFSWLAGAIKARLEVEQAFGARIVSITYTSTDPYIAALIADRVAEEYIATNIQMQVDPARRASVWFDQQIKDLKDTLDRKRHALIEFQQSEGIVATDEKLDLENSRLNRLSDQLIAAQQEWREAKTAMTQMEQVIAKGGSLLTLAQFNSHPVIQSIKSDIRRLEVQQTEMAEKFGKNHPKFKQVIAEIADLKSKQAREVNAIATEIKNAARLSNGKLNALTKAVSKQKTLVLDLKNQHADIAVLLSDVESSEQAYNKALDDFNKSNLNSLIQHTTISVVDPAVKPGSPSGPNMLKNLVVGATLGLTIALGLVLLLELVSRKIRSPEDIRELEIPLLGSLQNV